MFKPQNLIAVAIAGVVCFLFAGCGKQGAPSSQNSDQSQQPKPLAGPPEVTSEEESEDFRDLVFYIQDYQQLPDGSQSLHCVGTYKGNQLGLDVVLGQNWKVAPLDKNLPMTIYSGTLTYHSTGAESDAFIQTLDELYKTKASPKGMNATTQLVGMSLEGDPQDLKAGSVRIKTFFDNGNQDAYAEFYTNIQLANHRLEIAEKDSDYRLPIIKALATH